ncbi:thioesterase family protein [Clostridium sp. DL1XJH146]
MEINLQTGIEGKEQILVEYKDTAANVGSGLVEVFATPSMIALMENTAQKSVASLLPEGIATVGTTINIKHIKATPIGMSVVCNTKLIEIDNRRLVFAVEAFDEIGKIGGGIHERFIIDIEKFMSKL